MTERATGAAADDAAARNVAVLRTGYAAFASWDVPIVLALLDPDVRWVEASGGPFAGTFVGPEDVAAGVFGRVASEWAEFHVEPEEYIASGDAVAVLGTCRGTYRSTGKSMTSRFVHLYRFRDGRITRYESIDDTAVLNTVVG
jgi:ketosteroid isomerase-like protein